MATDPLRMGEPGGEMREAQKLRGCHWAGYAHGATQEPPQLSHAPPSDPSLDCSGAPERTLRISIPLDLEGLASGWGHSLSWPCPLEAGEEQASTLKCSPMPTRPPGGAVELAHVFAVLWVVERRAQGSRTLLGSVSPSSPSVSASHTGSSVV